MNDINDMTSYLMRKYAGRLVIIYATIAATFAFILAVDPEPISGTILVIFADTPFLTITTFTMIVHLCLYYGDRDILKDGFITVVGLAFGMVVGALGALILGGLVPFLKTANNAIVTFGLHYATGHAVIDIMDNGGSIRNIKIQELKEASKKYRDSGEKYGKRIKDAQSQMSESEKEELKTLNKKCIDIARRLAPEMKKENPNAYLVESLTKEMNNYGNQIAMIYEKHGMELDF